MGEAKHRGTFEQRREQAQAKLAALFAARPPQDRPVLAKPRQSMSRAAMAAQDALAMSQGVFIYRPGPGLAEKHTSTKEAN